MSHAIPVAAAILLCLALAGAATYLFCDPHWKAAVRYTAWRWYLLIAVRQRRVWDCWKLSDGKPRARGTAAAARPALEHCAGVPITDPAAVRAKVAALLDGDRPRNGVALPSRLRDTAPVVIDGPVVPRWYEEFERGWRP
jgi:hypothetical protein